MSEALASYQQQQVLMDAQFQQLQNRYRRNPVALEQAAALHDPQSSAMVEEIANLQRWRARTSGPGPVALSRDRRGR